MAATALVKIPLSVWQDYAYFLDQNKPVFNVE